MSMSEKTARLHWDAPAVLCCRTAKGAVIGPAHLEDPTLFPELEAAGLLALPAGVLTIGQALGATLRETADGLTALTADLVTDLPAAAVCGIGTAAPAARRSCAETSGSFALPIAITIHPLMRNRLVSKGSGTAQTIAPFSRLLAA